MTTIQLLQLTVNSFKAQIDNIDKELEQAVMMVNSMKEARSSMLASESVLSARIAELEAAEPEQFELPLEPLTYDEEADRFAADADDDLGELDNVVPFCQVGEECESCQ